MSLGDDSAFVIDLRVRDVELNGSPLGDEVSHCSLELGVGDLRRELPRDELACSPDQQIRFVGQDVCGDLVQAWCARDPG